MSWPGGMRLGHEHGVDHDLCAREQSRSLGVMRAPEAEHGRRLTERLGQVRERRDADASAYEERPRDVDVEAVAQRSEHMDRLSRPEGAKRLCSSAEGFDEERELPRRREAEAHRARQEPPGRLEHEELPRPPRIDVSSLDPQERVRPDALAACDVKQLPSQRAAPEG